MIRLNNGEVSNEKTNQNRTAGTHTNTGPVTCSQATINDNNYKNKKK